MCYVKFDKNLLKTNLSARAMILYALMANRAELSAANGWVDANGVYIYYTITAVMDEMHVSRSQAIRLLHELETEGLIQRQRQDGNRNKPLKIYLPRGAKNDTLRGVKNDTTRGVKNDTLIKRDNNNNRFRSNRKTDSYPATYDIALYESTSVIYEEDEEEMNVPK